MRRFSETSRQLVHVGVGLVALALPWLTWPQAAACAAAALAFNVFALPRLAGEVLFRPGELSGRTTAGIVLYPASVLMLIVLFRERLDLTAAAWGILAFGDGVATMAGRLAGRGARRWPWNPDKTWAGSAGFFAAGAVAGVALSLWTLPAVPAAVPAWFPWVAPVAAALVATFAETMPVRLDDNVTVPAAAAAVLWAATLVDASLAGDALRAVAERAPLALAVNAAVAYAGWRARTVSRSGLVGGLLVGMTIWLAAGGRAWALLLACFLVAAATSRLGMRRKRALGIEQEREGRRGAANALANCGLAAAAAVIGLLGPHAAACALAMTAALVSGASDTAASEVGKAWGQATFSPLTLSRVRPGEVGGLSVEGTVGGVLAAVALAALAAVLGLVPAAATWVVVAASAGAMLVESVLGATLEPRGLVNNDLLNFLQTAIAAALAVALWRVVA
ncbi:MAG: DUF92 domain-containing protein [Vicinamibacterales bacterium]|nr:DUF92 domain-containing protein [Vicinamibacterales bacterium]